MVTVVYCARLRESLGKASEQLALPPELRDVTALRAWLRKRGGPWAEELADGKPVRAAVNQEVAHGDAVIKDGDEVAFFPPVTGG